MLTSCILRDMQIIIILHNTMFLLICDRRNVSTEHCNVLYTRKKTQKNKHLNSQKTPLFCFQIYKFAAKCIIYYKKNQWLIHFFEYIKIFSLTYMYVLIPNAFTYLYLNKCTLVQKSYMYMILSLFVKWNTLIINMYDKELKQHKIIK